MSKINAEYHHYGYCKMLTLALERDGDWITISVDHKKTKLILNAETENKWVEKCFRHDDVEWLAERASIWAQYAEIDFDGVMRDIWTCTHVKN